MMTSEKDFICGLLSDIEENELDIIREKENYPISYVEKSIDVEQLSDGTKIHNVTTYKVAKNKETEKDQPPTKEYMDLIIKNAEKYDFPQEYIKYLESIPTKD